VLELPRTWPRVEASTTAVLAGQQEATPRRLDLPGLARLLHLSAGVVRVREATPTRPRMRFRAAGSAGGRFPLEIYVSARGVDGLEDGVHRYDPIGHALVQVGRHAAGKATTLVLTGVPWRTCWRYAERGYRHIYSEIERLIGAPRAGLLFTCVGVPTYSYKAGGMPGQPVSIRTPVAGDTPRAASPGS
jgi:hypothetical protein